MAPSTTLHYEAPWPVYAVDWCRTSGLGQQRLRSAYRLALGSFTEDYRNRIAVVGLTDERSLGDSGVEDEGYAETYGSAPSQQPSDFTILAETMHGYPVTKIAWEPASTLSQGWKGSESELLTTTGDALRIWEYFGEADATKPSGYVGRTQATPNRLTQKIALSSSKNANPTSPPLTSFSWNTIAPALVVSSSIDTTCTVWDISANSAVTQLIAHDREVYDVAWVPGSTDSFVSVGADGSLRAFDLRSLDHSTILYETPAPKLHQATTGTTSIPLLRISFNPLDSNFLATFHVDSSDVQVLDMRSPGKPVAELRGHRAALGAIGWGASEGSMLATAGDDCQLLVWDLNAAALSPRQHRSPAMTPSPHSTDAQPAHRILTDPILGYTAPGEIGNLTWSPPMPSVNLGGGTASAAGEWIAITAGRTIKALKV